MLTFPCTRLLGTHQCRADCMVPGGRCGTRQLTQQLCLSLPTAREGREGENEVRLSIHAFEVMPMRMLVEPVRRLLEIC